VQTDGVAGESYHIVAGAVVDGECAPRLVVVLDVKLVVLPPAPLLMVTLPVAVNDPPAAVKVSEPSPLVMVRLP